MALVTARISIKGKKFEIKVDLDEALKVRKDENGDITTALQSPGVYHDVGKGDAVAQSELESAFGTADLYQVAEKIIKDGEVQKTQDFRDSEREKKINQVVALIVQNAVDQNGRPYTDERIRRAIDEAHYSFDSRPADQQMAAVVDKLKSIIPIKLDLKKLKLTIPARFTGQVYGIINEYKKSEEWLSNGDLEALLEIPAGIQMDFYDKLNNSTHGAVQVEEVSD